MKFEIGFGKCEVIAQNKFDSICNAVYLGVVSREFEPCWRGVESDDYRQR